MKPHTILLPIQVQGTTAPEALRAARILAKEARSHLDNGLDELDDAMPKGALVTIAAPKGTTVAVDRAALQRFIEAYDRLSSLAGIISCGCDQADLPKAERGHDNEGHRCALPADEEAVKRALK